MAEELKNMQCTACQKGAPPVSNEEIKTLQPQIPEWQIVEHDYIPRLERVFRFSNFAEALDFTNQVGTQAEQAGHHPAILLEWGKVTVTWWTHKIKNLHRNDFIMAARTDQLYAEWSTA
jgi:4a-hydroxytetrahydrobiopterin dehydratase